MLKRDCAKVMDAERKLIEKWTTAFNTFKSDRDIKKFQDMQTIVESSVKIGRSRLVALSGNVCVKNLVLQLQKKLLVIKDAYNSVIPFYTKSDLTAEGKSAIKKILEKLNNDLPGLNSDIEKSFAEM